MENSEKPSVSIERLSSPVISGLTDGYKVEELLTSWRTAVELVEANPGDPYILFNQGLPPYIFIVDINVAPTDSLLPMATAFFTSFGDPQFRLWLIEEMNLWSKQRLTLKAKTRVCHFLIKYIRRLFVDDLSITKELIGAFNKICLGSLYSQMKLEYKGIGKPEVQMEITEDSVKVTSKTIRVNFGYTADAIGLSLIPIPDGIMIKDIEYVERNLPALREYIIKNRTSHINHEGNVIAANQLSAYLKENTEEIRITKNMETKKFPNGLACNVKWSRRYKPDEPVYCRLTAGGELIVRLLKENLELGREAFIERGIKDNIFLNEQIAIAEFDELNFMILEALAVICVRKKVDPVEDIGKKNEIPLIEPTGENTQIVEPPSGPEIVAGFPITGLRKDGKMTIDLTDAERVLRRKINKREKIRIQSNLGKVREIFINLSRGQELPENPPAEIKSLLLHQPVELKMREKGKMVKVIIYEAVNDPLAIYHKLRTGELKLNEVFVRESRACSQALSYHESPSEVTFPVDESDPDSEYRTVRYFKVKKNKRNAISAELKKDVFRQNESGGEIRIGDISKILHFDVRDLPEYQGIFEKVKSGELIPGILVTVRREIMELLAEKRRLVRAKCLENPKRDPDWPKYCQIMGRLERLADHKYQQIEQVCQEIAQKARRFSALVKTVNGEEEQSFLSLPQPGFHFEQTFNQGRFMTLAEVLGIK